MNIQQYYRSAASVALNGSFAALVPVITFIIPFYVIVPKKELIFLAVPFLIYSFISYQSYILNRERSLGSKVSSATINEGNISGNDYLLAFMPAPSLRLLLFDPDGLVTFEIRDTRYTKLRWFLPYFLDRLFPAEYGFFDANGQLLTKFKWVGKKGRICKEDGDRLLMIGGKSTEIQISETTGEQSIRVESKAMYTDIQFKNKQNETIARVRKGWMPLDWGEFFKDANTPILSFNDDLSEDDKLVILALLIRFYRYRNH